MRIKNQIVTELSYFNTKWKRELIKISKTFRSQFGIEIGGPSPVVFSLKGVFPVYVYASGVDGVNFSTSTIWEGKIKEGETYNYFQTQYGNQYIAEATDLNIIESGRYDFVLSSHSLEHVSNPIKALFEWNRVLKNSGRLVLVLPDKTNTFDANRNYTTFSHLLDDYYNNTDEHDNTHINEILELHDFTKDFTSDRTLFKTRLENNFVDRSAHHHVFNFDVIKQMLDFAGFTTIYQQACPPFHLATIAVKNY